MNNNHSIANMRIIICLAALIFNPLMAYSQQTKSIQEQLNEFIFSDEFKAPEIARLHAMPMESVNVLSEMLDKMKVGQQDEDRVFYCLSKKFIQHENKLPLADKNRAIEALVRKIQGALASVTWRLDVLKESNSPEIHQFLKSEKSPQAFAQDKDWSLQIVPTRVDKDSAWIGIPFYVVLTNTSKDDLTIWEEWCSLGYFCLTFDVTYPNGKTIKIKKKDRPWKKDYADSRLISSGQHYVWRIDWKDWSGFLKDDGGGKLMIRANFEIKGDSESAVYHVWTGQVFSSGLKAIAP